MVRREQGFQDRALPARVHDPGLQGLLELADALGGFGAGHQPVQDLLVQGIDARAQTLQGVGHQAGG